MEARNGEFGIEFDRNLFKRNSDWIDQVILVEFERQRQAMQLLKKIEDEQHEREAEIAYKFRDRITEF